MGTGDEDARRAQGGEERGQREDLVPVMSEHWWRRGRWGGDLVHTMSGEVRSRVHVLVQRHNMNNNNGIAKRCTVCFLVFARAEVHISELAEVHISELK